MIRLSQSCLGPEEIAAVTRVLQDGYLGMGNEVMLFEQELQKYIGNEVLVACVNTGTSALQLAVQACGIGTGDEVIVPSITYVASFQGITAAGAVAIACDIDLATGCIDVEAAQRCITSKTKAIMPVHYASGTGDLEGIYSLARQNGLRVIEDAAHSFGGTYKGAPVGAYGDIICFSFDGIKNITCGEGGALVSKDLDLIKSIQDLRLLGVEKDTENRFAGLRSWDFNVNQQGWRYHMSNINAAIGREQLKKIEKFAAIRRSLSKTYRDELQLTPLKLLNQDLTQIVPHIFVVIAPEKQRDDLRYMLMSKGIETGIHYKPNHLLQKFQKRGCSNAEQFAKQTLSLPLQCTLMESDVLSISQTIKEFFNSQ